MVPLNLTYQHRLQQFSFNNLQFIIFFLTSMYFAVKISVIEIGQSVVHLFPTAVKCLEEGGGMLFLDTYFVIPDKLVLL